ncbi:peptidoglycan DD-metalloendopeptidase family protein, partial [Candidatus Amesbacteria bacterium]|nr:peptidoglycan DD-metalloendopeptidase family protein [Candidatus Amesbacteria bacterium]
VGHNGIDYGLPEGIEVLSCDTGRVIQSGDNGDYGNSVTLQHAWGTSIYGHLKETKVSVDQEVKAGDLVGIPGQTGYVTGPHLHFGIKPSDADLNKGYLGFVDPSPYLSQVPQSPISPESPPSPPSPLPPEPQIIEKIVEVEKEVIREVPVEKEVIKEVIKDISEEKFRAKIVENQNLGNLAKKAKHDGNLNRIMQTAQEKKTISNSEVRELLHVSQSTATNYLNTLVDRGMLKADKKAKATVYIY